MLYEPVNLMEAVLYKKRYTTEVTQLIPIIENIDGILSRQTFLQIKNTTDKTTIIRTKILVTKGLTNTFLTSEKSTILQQKRPKISGSKMHVIQKFRN